MPLASGQLSAPQLAGFALLAGLTPAALRGFAAVLRCHDFDPGQIILQQGETTRDVYFVLSGRVVGLLGSTDGRDVAYSVIGPRSYFGELSALDGAPRSLTVSAVDKTRLAQISGDHFMEWITRQPTLMRNLTLDLAARNRQLTERVFGLVVHDAETRLRLYLSRLAQEQGQLRAGGVLEPAPTRDDMARYVGVNREAVSRMIARLTRAGVIDSARRRIVIRQPTQLVQGDAP